MLTFPFNLHSFSKDTLDMFKVKLTCENVAFTFKSITMSKCRGETLNKHRTKSGKTKSLSKETPSDSFKDGLCRR